MKYKIKELSKSYSDKGDAMGKAIQSLLKGYELPIIHFSPTSIQFIPWPVNNSQITKDLDGFVFWNPMTSLVEIQYVLHQAVSVSYKRCLKWHFMKLNEQYLKEFRKTNVHFIYPVENSTDVILQAQCNISENNIEKKIRMLLLQLNDIIEEEGDTIISILAGNPPDKFKKEMLEEIAMILSEMKGG